VTNPAAERRGRSVGTGTHGLPGLSLSVLTTTVAVLTTAGLSLAQISPERLTTDDLAVLACLDGSYADLAREALGERRAA
jgi:hypothetical protein